MFEDNWTYHFQNLYLHWKIEFSMELFCAIIEPMKLILLIVFYLQCCIHQIWQETVFAIINLNLICSLEITHCWTCVVIVILECVSSAFCNYCICVLSDNISWKSMLGWVIIMVLVLIQLCFSPLSARGPCSRLVVVWSSD